MPRSAPDDDFKYYDDYGTLEHPTFFGEKPRKRSKYGDEDVTPKDEMARVRARIVKPKKDEDKGIHGEGPTWLLDES